MVRCVRYGYTFSENVCENITNLWVDFRGLLVVWGAWFVGWFLKERSYLTMNTNLCFYLLCIKNCMFKRCDLKIISFVALQNPIILLMFLN